jgi:lipopolysaccharide transport system permease protein
MTDSQHLALQTDAAGAVAAAPGDWVIEPRGRKWSAQLREIWHYRRLFRFFGKRAVERLYRGTFLGRAWLFIRPLFPLTIRTLVFGGLLAVDTPGVPYFVFLTVGSSIWDLFSSCLMWSMRSLQFNRGFLGRMYFPRIIVPMATMSIAFVNFLIMMGVLAGVLAYYYFADGRLYLASPLQMVWALGALILAVALGLGIGLWAAPLNAQYRDVRFTLMYVLEFWALLTPILYPLSAVPQKYQWIVFLNPLAGIVQAFKWGVLGVEDVNRVAFAVDAGIVLVVLLSGLWYFGRVEGDAVDRI